MKTVSVTSLLMCCAGLACAQPTIDGSKDASYGPAQWVNADNPTGFGDNAPVGGCNENDVGNPGAVTTGIEWAIPLTAIGNPAAADIKLSGFITNGGFNDMSNQIFGGLAAGTQNLGESRAVNFTSIAGTQHFSGITETAGVAPVVDGTLDASYGAAKFIQSVRTGYGDNTNATGGANGSEIDAVYATVKDGVLYVMITGNLNSDFTKLSLFVDSIAGGQSTLAADNPDVDFNGLNRLGGPAAEGAGVTFDTGFTADYWLGVTNGGTPTLYANYARLRPSAGDPGEGYYMGSHDVGVGATLGGGNNPNNISVEINNSNIAGVPATCPPPTGTVDFAAGSEIDGVYATAVGSRLYVLVTGNLQTNFNKLDLFFDVDSTTSAAGQNTMRNNNVDIDFNGLNRYGSGAEGTGLTFDSGFTADYWVGATNGGGGAGNTQMYSNAAVLRTDGPIRNFNDENLDYGAYDGGPRASNNPIDYAGTRLDIQTGGIANLFCNYAPRSAQLEVFNVPTPIVNTDALRMSLDNSNVLGVTGTTSSDAAARAVSTGWEYEFRLDELGWDHSSPIRLAGWITDGGHGYMSNQVIGGLPAGAANMAEVRAIDFNAVAGTQYITLNVSPCAGDFNADTVVDFFDYLDFVDKFSANDTRADFNLDGVIDFFDYLDFVDAFSVGC